MSSNEQHLMYSKRRKNMKKRAFAIFLASAMILTAFPSAVFAEADAKDTAGSEKTDETADPDEVDDADDPDDAEDEAASDNAEDPADLDEALIDADPEIVTKGDPAISRRNLPCYMITMGMRRELPLYFVNDIPDIPYMEVDSLTELLTQVYHDLLKDEGYSLEAIKEGTSVTFVRENDYILKIDFDERTMVFDDYEAFTHSSSDTSLMDRVITNASDKNGNDLMLTRDKKGAYDRYGKKVEIDLADYDIPLYYSEENDLYLVPVQTLSDFLFALPTNTYWVFNGKKLYLLGQESLKSDEGLTPMGMDCVNGIAITSSELIDFNYNSLCLAMDKLYGQKELHQITSFDEMFIETGYKDKLHDKDTGIIDGALKDFIALDLDDLHSGFIHSSYRDDEGAISDNDCGPSMKLALADGDRFSAARNEAGNKIKCYDEVDNTAYVTFDRMKSSSRIADYYDYDTKDFNPETDPADPALDTVELILYAHEQITREDSPIENVVLDFSLNGGGEIDASAIFAAWVLGEAEISTKSTLSGATSTVLYKADINRDKKFDEKDTIADKNLYCLISPNSFSCGNLVPALFKYSHKVTLLGQQSGGGSCSMQILSTALGALYAISSPYCLSHVMNGVYYSIDTGVEPDYRIDKIENYYNRDNLTEYINLLF